jgi:hypothetical protein
VGDEQRAEVQRADQTGQLREWRAPASSSAISGKKRVVSQKEPPSRTRRDAEGSGPLESLVSAREVGDNAEPPARELDPGRGSAMVG